MIDSGFALAVMGNHEYNAICYHTPGKDGRKWLRERNDKNRKQHRATLAAFNDFPDEWKDYLEWFLTLPVYLDLGQIRVVHAFWDHATLQSLSRCLNGNRMSQEFIHQSSVNDSKEFHWVENILKGYELSLPDDIRYTDKDGFVRGEIRVKWWKRPNRETYRSICVKDGQGLPERPISQDILDGIPVYPENEPPVFIGHYWNSGKPELMAHNVCCVDYSIARGEKLLAYRWNGEKSLNTGNFVIQECMDF